MPSGISPEQPRGHAVKMVAQTAQYIILDNLLPEAAWEDVLNSVCHESFYPAHVVGQFSRTWRYEGGLPASSNSYLRSKGPVANYPQVMFDVFDRLAQNLTTFIKPGWDDIRVHAHLCPRGTKLHWHLDQHGHCAFTYWIHKRWECSWGGELMIPAVDPVSIKPKWSFTNEYESQHLQQGIGIYIAPKPNRCVVTAPGVYHQVNRIDPDAGDNVRVSVVGFLVSSNSQQKAMM